MLSARQDTSWANTKLVQPSAGINHLPYIASFVTRAPNGEYDGIMALELEFRSKTEAGPRRTMVLR
jgi:hypothetical protein